MLSDLLYPSELRDRNDYSTTHELWNSTFAKQNDWRDRFAAIPKRKDNVDTYAYFGEPVFIYFLKEGINDGFLTPFKVRQISTGVDARNIRNIILMRPVNSMIEFNQIIGRGTQLIEGKEFFTIYDFEVAYLIFASRWNTDVGTSIYGDALRKASRFL